MLKSTQALLDAIDGVAYLLDLEDRIAAYGRPNWERFARGNDAPELLDPDRVLGRRLFDFVQGEEVRDVYARILKDIRSGAAESVTIPFRCDSPRLRRELRMSIAPVLRGPDQIGCLFCSTAIAEDERPPIDLYDFKALAEAWAAHTQRPLVAMCSFCQRVRSGETGEEWAEAEDYYRAGGTSAVAISHGVCPACVSKVEDALAA